MSCMLCIVVWNVIFHNTELGKYKAVLFVSIHDQIIRETFAPITCAFIMSDISISSTKFSSILFFLSPFIFLISSSFFFYFFLLHYFLYRSVRTQHSCIPLFDCMFLQWRKKRDPDSSILCELHKATAAATACSCIHTYIYIYIYKCYQDCCVCRV